MELVNNPNFLWFIGIYALIMIAIGIFYSKKIDNSEDFILAGRGLGTIVLMGTLLATWVGSGTVTGGPNSLAYSFGLWPAVFFTIPSIVGILIMFKIAPIAIPIMEYFALPSERNVLFKIILMIMNVYPKRIYLP